MSTASSRSRAVPFHGHARRGLTAGAAGRRPTSSSSPGRVRPPGRGAAGTGPPRRREATAPPAARRRGARRAARGADRPAASASSGARGRSPRGRACNSSSLRPATWTRRRDRRPVLGLLGRDREARRARARSARHTTGSRGPWLTLHRPVNRRVFEPAVARRAAPVVPRSPSATAATSSPPRPAASRSRGASAGCARAGREGRACRTGSPRPGTAPGGRRRPRGAGWARARGIRGHEGGGRQPAARHVAVGHGCDATTPSTRVSKRQADASSAGCVTAWRGGL